MQGHAVVAELVGQPRGRVGIHQLGPECRVACEQRHLALGRAQGGGGFHGDEAAADDDDAALDPGHFSQCHRVAESAQVEHVAQVGARHRRPHRPAAGGQTRLLELDGLSVAEHGQVAVEVELGDHGVQAQVDLVLFVPVGWMVRELGDRVVLFAEELFGKGQPHVGRRALVADEHHLAALVVLADAFTHARAGGPSSDHQVVAFNHGWRRSCRRIRAGVALRRFRTSL